MTAIQKLNQIARITSQYQKAAHQKRLGLTLAQVTIECQKHDVKAAELTTVYQQEMAQAEIEAAGLA